MSYVYDCFDRLTGETWTGSGAGAPPPACNNNIQALTPGNRSGFAGDSCATPGGTGGTFHIATWEYDGAGNRTKQTADGAVTDYVYDDQNRLKTEMEGAATITYSYDSNGNQVGRDDGTNAESLTYDHANRLETYTKQPSQGGALSVNFMYVYMPTGERLKKVDFLAVTEEVFMYDGDDVTADYTRAIGSSTFPNADRTYVNTPGSIDSKIARIEAGSPEVVRYYVGDAIGSVHQMIAANGTKIRESLYTAWGEDLPGFTGTGFSDRHAFTQRERDEETADASGTALMHFRARSYDPRTGRFIQNDPFLKERIRQHFIYAANRPVDLKDPRGTQTVQDIEQEVTNHFYFRRAFQPLKDDGWRIRRKGFWVHNSDYDLSTRTELPQFPWTVETGSSDILLECGGADVAQ